MHQVIWLFKWLLKVAIFFTLFAFALNNQHTVTVRFFFGQQWTVPLVIMVLAAFAVGLVIGIFGMLPLWWKHRQEAAAARQVAATAVAPSSSPPELPPHGL
jgi:lipopolysaccharide assembly protein A